MAADRNPHDEVREMPWLEVSRWWLAIEFARMRREKKMGELILALRQIEQKTMERPIGGPDG